MAAGEVLAGVPKQPTWWGCPDGFGPIPPPPPHTHTVELCLVMWLLCRRWRLALQVGLLRLAFWVAAVVQDVTALVLPPLAA